MGIEMYICLPNLIGWDMEIMLFSKWRPSAISNLRKLKRSRDLYRHVILYLCSKFRVDRPIWRRDIAKKLFSIWRLSAILNLHNFDFLLNVHHGNWDVHLPTKFDRLRYGDNAIFKMAAVRHLEFAKIAVLVTWPISACDPSSLFQISLWSGNMAPRYSQKTTFRIWFLMMTKSANSFHVLPPVWRVVII